MSIFDLVLIIIIGIFGLMGLWSGLVNAVGNLIGIILGVILASRYYEPVSNWVMQKTGWGANFSKVLIFIVVFVIIVKLVGLVIWLIEKALGIITNLPFIKSLNKILGCIFGLVEGAIIVGLSIYFISRFPVSGGLMDAIAHSTVAPPLVKFASFLVPLMPEALRLIKSTIGGIV